MEIVIRPCGQDALDEHLRIPIRFTVDSFLALADAEAAGWRGLPLVERAQIPGYVKDYDAIPGGDPRLWAQRFDLSTWALFAAYQAGVHVGGLVLAHGTAQVHLLDGRSDLALIWDLRVAEGARRHGIGGRLFQSAVVWAREHGCRQLKVETQNINVAACRFYARQGCVLGAINRFAYEAHPSEIQMLWYHDLEMRRRGIPE